MAVPFPKKDLPPPEISPLQAYLNEIQLKHAEASRQAKRITKLQFETCLPLPLLARVAKCIPIEDILEDSLAGDGSKTTNDVRKSLYRMCKKTVRKKERPNVYEAMKTSTSTISAMNESDTLGPRVIIEPLPEPRMPPAKPRHFSRRLLTDPLHVRVRWPSKLYNRSQRFTSMSFFQQTDEISKMVADDMALWLSQLGHPDDQTYDGAAIVSMFTMAGNNEAGRGMSIFPVRKHAVPQSMAVAMNMPEFSITTKVDHYLKLDEIAKRKPKKMIAFGRLLPPEMRQTDHQDWIPPKEVKFPAACRTRENVFKGISHFRSVKHLVDYIEENPSVKLPSYLRQERQRSKAEQNQSGDKYISLYNYLNDPTYKL